MFSHFAVIVALLPHVVLGSVNTTEKPTDNSTSSGTSCVEMLPVLRAEFANTTNALHILIQAVNEDLNEYGTTFFLNPIAASVKNSSTSFVGFVAETLQTASNLSNCVMKAAEENAAHLSAAQERHRTLENNANSTEIKVQEAQKDLKIAEDAKGESDEGLRKAKEALATSEEKLKKAKCGTFWTIVTIGLCNLWKAITGEVRDAKSFVQKNEQAVRDQEGRHTSLQNNFKNMQDELHRIKTQKQEELREIESSKQTRDVVDAMLNKSISFRKDVLETKTRLDAFENHAKAAHDALTEEVYVDLDNILKPLDEMKRMLSGLINCTTILAHGNATSINETGVDSDAPLANPRNEESKNLRQKLRRTKIEAGRFSKLQDEIGSLTRQLQQKSANAAGIQTASKGANSVQSGATQAAPPYQDPSTGVIHAPNQMLKSSAIVGQPHYQSQVQPHFQQQFHQQQQQQQQQPFQQQQQQLPVQHPHQQPKQYQHPYQHQQPMRRPFPKQLIRPM